MRRIHIVVLCTAVLSWSQPAWADHKVYSPIIEQHVLELELRGDRTVDPASARNDRQSHLFELAYGVNSWWYTALFGVLDKPPQAGQRYSATAWENIFQLTPQGKYWADVGLYLEYRKSHLADEPDEFESKLLLEKDAGPLVLTANLIFNREIGTDAGKGVGFEYAVRANYPWRRGIQFGVEAYGEPGRLTGFEPVAAQSHIIGPVISGQFNIGQLPGIFGYNIGYLFGLTPGSPNGTAKWELEYEIPF